MNDLIGSTKRVVNPTVSLLLRIILIFFPCLSIEKAIQSIEIGIGLHVELMSKQESNMYRWGPFSFFSSFM